MNKNKKTLFGNYSYSIRTSGEVVGLFIREKEVICKLVLFIGAKLQLFLLYNIVFMFCNKILMKCCFFFYFLTNGGSNLLETSPNPNLTPLFLQNPFMITVSPSFMNLRSVPSLSLMGFFPPHVSSSIEP